jgi:hypothetical protein
MKTRQLRKQEAKRYRELAKKGQIDIKDRRCWFAPILGQLHATGLNHAARRRNGVAKKKSADSWRKKAWLWGIRWPKPRTQSVVDPTAVVMSGQNKRVPIAVTELAMQKRAKRLRVRVDPRHTRERAQTC